MNSPTLTDAQKVQLHDLKLRGMATVEDAQLADELVELGLARRRGAALSLTPEGRVAVEADARLESPEREVVSSSYESFLVQNARFLEICSSWQLKPGGDPNDHTDATYDWEVIERLTDVHDRIGALLAHVGGTVARFAAYPTLLDAALTRLDAGELEWFTSPRVDSYHTVWMHLHEEFRLALGVSAAGEEAGAGGAGPA